MLSGGGGRRPVVGRRLAGREVLNPLVGQVLDLGAPESVRRRSWCGRTCDWPFSTPDYEDGGDFLTDRDGDGLTYPGS